MGLFSFTVSQHSNTSFTLSDGWWFRNFKFRAALRIYRNVAKKGKKNVGHQRANADWKSVMSSFARAPASALLPLYLKSWRSDVTLQRDYFCRWVLRKYIFLAKLWRPRSNTKTPRPMLRNQEMDKSSSNFPRHHVTGESFAPLGHSVTVLTPSPMIHIKSLFMRFNVIDP